MFIQQFLKRRSDYIVTVPDVPCKFNQGDDMADAIFMAEDVLALQETLSQKLDIKI